MKYYRPAAVMNRKQTLFKILRFYKCQFKATLANSLKVNNNKCHITLIT